MKFIGSSYGMSLRKKNAIIFYIIYTFKQSNANFLMTSNLSNPGSAARMKWEDSSAYAQDRKFGPRNVFNSIFSLSPRFEGLAAKRGAKMFTVFFKRAKNLIKKKKFV